MSSNMGRSQMKLDVLNELVLYCVLEQPYDTIEHQRSGFLVRWLLRARYS